MKETLICTKAKKVEGYIKLRDFTTWIDGLGILCVTKGPVSDGGLHVQLRDDIPFSEISDEISQFNEVHEDEYNMAANCADELVARGEKMFISDKIIHFNFIDTEYFPELDDVAEVDCNADVDCGHFTDYYPTTTPGVYRIKTGVTCGLDLCSYETIRYSFLTVDNYHELQQAATNISC